jgi:hypothetical protein
VTAAHGAQNRGGTRSALDPRTLARKNRHAARHFGFELWEFFIWIGSERKVKIIVDTTGCGLRLSARYRLTECDAASSIH